jgi:hypothetical protein
MLPVASAEAQKAAPVPDRRMFGHDRRDPNRREQADFSMFFNVTNDTGQKLREGSDRTVLDRWTTREGAYSAVGGLLTYRKKHRRIVFDADARSTVQYHPQLTDTIGDYGARVAVQTPVGRRMDLSASHSSSYFQSYQLPMLADQPVQTGGFADMSEAQQALSRLAAYTSFTNVRAVHRVSARSSIDLDYDIQSTQFAGDETDLHTWGARGRFSHRMTRSASLRLGYGQRVGRYGAAASRVRIHDVDLGVDYTRTLGRSMTLNIAPGSSVAVGSEGRQYRMTGDVVAKRRLGRSWDATMLYRRSSEFIEGFADPFFVDSATARVAGHLGRRVDLAASAGYSTGDLWSMSHAMYDSYSASTRVRYALDRHVAVSVEYLFYNHRFDGVVAVPTAAAVNRHSMRVGLSWWRPLQ